jgi:hypothetical protein
MNPNVNRYEFGPQLLTIKDPYETVIKTGNYYHLVFYIFLF